SFTSWPRWSRLPGSSTSTAFSSRRATSRPTPRLEAGRMTETLIGLAAMLLLSVVRIPIALSMGIVGFVGYAYMREWNWAPAFAMVQTQLYETGRNYTLSVIPLFVLMGTFVARAGMAEDLFRAAYAFVGHRRGGLAMATIVDAAGFGGPCGS